MWQSIRNCFLAAQVLLWAVVSAVCATDAVCVQADVTNEVSLAAVDRRGDLNQDGVINTVDIVLMTRLLYIGEHMPVADKSTDLDCDGRITSVDGALLIEYVYRGKKFTSC